MAIRYHGRASVDPSSPRAFAVCDRCGCWKNQIDLKWQMQYAGPTLVNLRLLVCDQCLDTPQQQLRTIIIPADPPPIYNARPEPFVLDETDWLSTQDGDEITTQSGDPIITQLPNPDTETTFANEDVVSEEAAVPLETEDGVEIVTEDGEGNPINYEPNP